jgi:hypothetical protein
MAIFHVPLFLNPNISFYKLMGTGKNGTFDKTPDFNQWAILCVFKENSQHSNKAFNPLNSLGSFIKNWLRLFSMETFSIHLEPINGHGLWDGKTIFGYLDSNTNYDGPIATLTRATIRLNKMSHFWKHVAPIANKMTGAKGYVFSVGIGEVPWIKQATFSVWESVEDMKTFAYSMKEHREVVKKTRQEKWYSEDMFVRFKIISTYGTLKGIDPLKRIL